ncbi:hypothetical protein V7S43_007124 [Phytophthora oleae]|uniref:PiggyBac transposable element-derived protein domain-containing protein n=1 Tax=Phytophthora oleae TaxID=2107226 RepID=A0ABD3FPK6_9STRA
MPPPPQESKKQFRWFLEEFAATRSTREAFVEKHNWGCSELMAMAANFLQRPIFVMAYNIDGKRQWNCNMYRPSTATGGSKVFETGQQLMLTVQECVAQIRAHKCQK